MSSGCRSEKHAFQHVIQQKYEKKTYMRTFLVIPCTQCTL